MLSLCRYFMFMFELLLVTTLKLYMLTCWVIGMGEKAMDSLCHCV